MSQKTIMIVDDAASVREVVVLSLARAGFDVLQAGNGREALSKLVGQKINLIITDLNMPEMDGISLIRSVRKLPAYRFTPIMIMTTENEEARKRQGQEAGAKAWVTKPFRPDQLMLAVNKLCLP